MRVAERPGVNFDGYYKRHVPGVGYAIDGSPVSAPGPALVLERAAVEITIHNALTNATSVHWHGIEVQSSYYDGVPHWGVDGDRVTRVDRSRRQLRRAFHAAAPARSCTARTSTITRS